jgi:ribosome biogenesis GTPase / thiamine phosphate phosphatase
MKAIVYKSTGSWYTVKSTEGNWYNVRIKGKFKIDEIFSTNPIAVGDEVEIETEDESEASLVIVNIYPRKNYITRLSPRNKFHHHIIAANLDQSIMMATLKEPKTSQGFIDRYVVACEAYHVPAVIVFNKSDLYGEKENEKLYHLQHMYESVGYRTLTISLKNNIGLEEAKQLLLNKKTLLSGHSGVGKSTFINGIIPEFSLKTLDISAWSGKGMHTTTFSEMFDLPGGGSLIDTPGLREFALMDITKNELSHYFPEMKKLIHSCRFNNCIHVEEPGCAVKNAVEQGTIEFDRYNSYLNILYSM